MYSIDDSDTFDSLTGWSENAISARVDGDTLFVLVGNKSDLASERQVDKSRARQYAKNIDIDDDMVFEVSALSGKGFDSMFDAVALKMGPVAQQPAQKADTDGTRARGRGRRKTKCC